MSTSLGQNSNDNLFQAVNLWLEYAQSSIKNLQTAEARSAVREIFERALTAVGLHVSDSGVIWDSYREFEVAILATLQAQNMESSEQTEDSNEIKEQKQRILKLFKRQLSVPLFGRISKKYFCVWQINGSK